MSIERVLSHPTVMALDEPTRVVLCALLWEADERGELPEPEARAQALWATRDPQQATACVERLRTVRLLHEDKPAGVVVVWHPRGCDGVAS